VTYEFLLVLGYRDITQILSQKRQQMFKNRFNILTRQTKKSSLDKH